MPPTCYKQPYMPKHTIFLTTLLILLITPFIVNAKQKPTKPEASTIELLTTSQDKRLIRADTNNNQLTDNLETHLTQLKPEEIIPVIIQQTSPQIPTDIPVDKEFPSINAYSTKLTKSQIQALAKDPTIKLIEDDAIVYPFLDSSNSTFGTTQARTDFSLDGNADGLSTYSPDDLVIAIIDTGLDPNHLDLDADKIIAWQDFTASPSATPYDETGPCVGHGTHVGSIAAGEGQANPNYQGVAPGAGLIGLKVLGITDLGCSGSTSQVNAALQWLISNKTAYGIEVANLSLGVPGCSFGEDSTSQLITQVTNAGITVVVSAGNEGPYTCSVGSPAAAPDAITVGAMADLNPASFAGGFSCGNAPSDGLYLACFSSRGPTLDGRIKPEIVSPGVYIEAAQAGTTTSYQTLSGTSMASPFTAGVVALMLQANPTLAPSQVKQILEQTAIDWGTPGKDNEYGSGVLQAYQAITQAGSLTGTPPSLPDHLYLEGSIDDTHTEDLININITDTSVPIAVTAIFPNWASPTNYDLDIALYDSNNNLLASSQTAYRQETLATQPLSPGTYQLLVYQYTGSGSYQLDISAGLPEVSISLTSDGKVEFGIVPLDTLINAPAPQTIEILSGPADLSVQATDFIASDSAWMLSESAAEDTAILTFSSDGTTYQTLPAANQALPFVSGLNTSQTQDLYLQLHTPTFSASTQKHQSDLTIVATSP